MKQERRREDERRRTQEIKFTKEDMERVRLSMNGEYAKSPSRDQDSQSRYGVVNNLCCGQPLSHSVFLTLFLPIFFHLPVFQSVNFFTFFTTWG